MRLAPSVVLCVLVGAAGSAAGEELWRQNPINLFGGVSTQDARNSGGLGWFSEVVDNFEAESAWTIEGVEFWGGYAQIQPGNTHGFMIRVYHFDDGVRGALVQTQDAMTFSEVVYYTSESGLPGYHYTAGLPQPVVLPHAGSYLISVVAILDRGGTATEPQWGWIQAQTMTPPPCHQTFFGLSLPQTFDVSFVLNGTRPNACGSADFDGDGDSGTDADIEAFFACLAGTCCATCGTADFDGDGDVGTDADIEAFFRVLAGGTC